MLDSSSLFHVRATPCTRFFHIYLLTPCSTVLLSKLTSFSQSRNSPHFMEPEGSLPQSQVPATCPYIPQSHFLKIHLNIILPSTPVSPKCSPSFRFPHQNPLYLSPLPHTRYMPRSVLNQFPSLVPNLNPIFPAYCLLH
jgi:hypothetical protein